MSKSKGATDKVIKSVVVKIGGREWPIVVTHNVLIECEEVTGLNLLTGRGVNIFEPSYKLVRGLLYCCLRRAGAKYTLSEVGDLITPDNLAMVGNALVEAYMASMPEKQPTEVDEDGEERTTPRPMVASA